MEFNRTNYRAGEKDLHGRAEASMKCRDDGLVNGGDVRPGKRPQGELVSHLLNSYERHFSFGRFNIRADA